MAVSRALVRLARQRQGAWCARARGLAAEAEREGSAAAAGGKQAPEAEEGAAGGKEAAGGEGGGTPEEKDKKGGGENFFGAFARTLKEEVTGSSAPIGGEQLTGSVREMARKAEEARRRLSKTQVWEKAREATEQFKSRRAG
eukprot:CAMPEP_0183817786 /NCGR_PEP_ID=MMETSP0803_2-20130417/61042_1 /TAXON_ID=195967 /ORGANISM="Crustomastix stigmata, Strain CCMP3273" /LENGTH=141 /DNA_ID=CAMNT_0026062671 /DNA_START=10 /DNA_END=432 /DNA_ORIENTATION=+